MLKNVVAVQNTSVVVDSVSVISLQYISYPSLMVTPPGGGRLQKHVLTGRLLLEREREFETVSHYRNCSKPYSST